MKIKYRPTMILLIASLFIGLGACSTLPESFLSSSDTNPPNLPVSEISIPGVPDEAISLFAQNCTACHGPSGEGSGIAPPLNSEELRTRLDDNAIKQTITEGRPGTPMPVWGEQLTENQIESLVALIRNMDKMDNEQLAVLAEQAERCDQGMGMHLGMRGRGPMMSIGAACGTPK